jgi:alpha 1,2-mannosyltransferase
MSIKTQFTPYILILLALVVYSNTLEATSDNSEGSFIKRKDVLAFWAEFEKDLISVAPKDEFLPRTSDIMPVYQDNHDTIPRPNMLNVTKDTVKHLRHMHEIIVNTINEKAPRLVYNPNTFGYVMTCDPKAYNYMIVTIRMLRKAGSTLPIELFIPVPEEYDANVCENILPALNTKCIILSDAVKNVVIKKYQYKVFSMLFSSFENIFFLDVDNIAVLNPDEMFTSPMFKQYGMISWLDFWAETISPHYFEIISRPIPPNCTHYSAEAGQLVMSKRKHAKTLLLAVYYNLYGPGHYYRLLTQNSHGEGDKETFYTAADYWKEPYYKLQSLPVQLNYYKHGSYGFLAMVQPHATDVWNKFNYNDTKATVRFMFIHANWPKLDIPSLMQPNSLAIDEHGNHVRVWASKTVMEEAFGYDIEKRLWEEIIPVTHQLYPHLVSKVEQHYRIAIAETEMQPNTKRKLYVIIPLLLIALGLGYIYLKKYRAFNRKVTKGARAH